jgi:hypothetical protein
MAEEIKPDYHCSQKDLYSILETAWENYDGHQPEFALHKALYTVLYSTNAKAAVAAAKALPDNQARGEAAETLRVSLVTQGETCRHNFRKLKSYIITAFPNEEVQKAKFEAAGQLYYSDAGNEDWESIESLNQSGSNFIAAESVALLAGNNMPAGFQAAYDADKDDFHTNYNDFKVAEQTSEQTADKIKANNAIFKTGMDMMKDGQIIFTNDADILVKFTFQSLWDLINPPVAGIKGNVKRASDNLPSGGATVTAQKEGEPVETTETDDEGDYSLRLAAGTYHVTVSATGFVTQSIDVVVETGNYRTINFSMVAG